MTPVSIDNFYVGTKVTWERLSHGDRAFDLADELKKTFIVVKPRGSNSTYFIDELNGVVYRLSDHWNRVNSCFWPLDNPLCDWQLIRRISVIAKANFADFIKY